jgi:hypothetical protein
MTTAASGASSPAHHRTQVHHGQVSRAFKATSGVFVSRLEGGHAVEIPASDADQQDTVAEV